jgi:hypothetical protein
MPLTPSNGAPAVLGVVEHPERGADFLARPEIGSGLGGDVAQQHHDRLRELEQDISDETVANHHVQPAMLGVAAQQIPAFDVADVVDAGIVAQQTVSLFDRRGALLFFLADVEQAHLRLGAAQDLAHVDGSQCAKPTSSLGSSPRSRRRRA